MAVKKLLVKTKKDSDGKPKLVIHKNPTGEEAAEPTEEVQAETTTAKASMKVADETGHEVIGAVSATKNNGAVPDIDYQELLAVLKSNTPMANVGFGMDRTINLGNYENVKIHVAIHVPSIPDEEEIEGNYVFAQGWVEQKMEEVVKIYTGE